MSVKVQPGDWVRFMNNGRLIIGKVEYIVRRSTARHEEIVTDAGTVTPDYVLEIREKQDNAELFPT